MAQIIMDDGATLEVGAFAGYTTTMGERDGEPVAVLGVRFEVTAEQLGAHGAFLHALTTKKWDEAEAIKRAKLLQLLGDE